MVLVNAQNPNALGLHQKPIYPLATFVATVTICCRDWCFNASGLGLFAINEPSAMGDH